MSKPKVATVFLAGCFGCHMSLLDIDERLGRLAEIVDLAKSPLTDIKVFAERCRIGLIEGSCANEENVHLLRMLRANCDILVSVGECAIQGDIPSLRNTIPLRECLEEAYCDGPSVYKPSARIPDDPELPLLLNRVTPCHEVVKVDWFLPGCPARADAIWSALVALLNDKPIRLPYDLLKYD
ncbi:MAG: NADP oxidoreductase [Chitinivibrionales bacterium]|nr:NADP oxidoreductase [Chitinivibrionales bacterium]MBD3357667.1 NADP oxidoreductase [Chitinivibrionales bacterium]